MSMGPDRRKWLTAVCLIATLERWPPLGVTEAGTEESERRVWKVNQQRQLK
jgi:hypothetical protein